jgi:hypothetical protein
LSALFQDRSYTPAKLIRDRPARTASTRHTSRPATSAADAPPGGPEVGGPEVGMAEVGMAEVGMAEVGMAEVRHQGMVSTQESSSSPTT